MQMMSMKLIDIDAKLKNANAINAKGCLTENRGTL